MSIQSTRTLFDLTYHSEWQDGFGAQGWKLDVAINDPQVIACTAYTGNKTPTTVLVHDLLDHLVSGFWLSGYANEARATAIHGLRNGIEVRSSYEWMTKEILNDKPPLDHFTEFLPEKITGHIPARYTYAEKTTFLFKEYALNDIRNYILENFYRIGLSGIPIAISHWQNKGLDFKNMYSIGMCLQDLLVEAQEVIKTWNVEAATGQILVDNISCEFLVETGDSPRQERIVKRVTESD